MSDQLPARQARSAEPAGALRIVATVAVCIGVAALAGAAFVLSYPGIHAVALQAGISARLARGYPLMLDVLLVIVLAAALSLRGAGWPSRLLAWFALLALLAAAAGADALHAAGRRLPARPGEITAAILPWALVLIAFALLLAMLRHARLRRAAAAERGTADGIPRVQRQGPVPSPLPGQPLVPGFAARPAGPAPDDSVRGPNDTISLVVPRQITAASAADAVADLAHPDQQPAAHAGGPDAELAIESEPAADDPSSDETALDPADGSLPYPAESVMAGQLAESDGENADATAVTPGPAPTDGDTAADPEMPVFHRMWSTPVPPAAADE